MGQVDLHFRPSVAVFDANMALGRRHDRPVRSHTAQGALAAMDMAGVQRAVVYSQHAVEFDGPQGNELLIELTVGEPRFAPQFVVNPAFDKMETFAESVQAHDVRSVRMAPKPHDYPFRDWVVGPWMGWLAETGMPLWLHAGQIDPSEVHDTLRDNPRVQAVLSEVHYSHTNWALPLLAALPNLNVEYSRFVNLWGIETLLDTVGEGRLMFGSRFPDSPISPQLYQLHRYGLGESSLTAICSGNLERLLRMG